MDNGREVSPMPMVSPCKIVVDNSDGLTGPKADDVCNGYTKNVWLFFL